MWLPPLPARQDLSSVLDAPPWWERGAGDDAGAQGGVRTTVGLLDRPTEQRQDPFVLDLAGIGGHVAVVGASQTGKSTLLRTVLTSLFVTYEPAELRRTRSTSAADCCARSAPRPHVGGVSGKVEPEQVRADDPPAARAHRRTRGALPRARHRLDGGRPRPRAHGLLDAEHAADVLLVIDNWAGLLRDYEELDRRSDRDRSRGPPARRPSGGDREPLGRDPPGDPRGVRHATRAAAERSDGVGFRSPGR